MKALITGASSGIGKAIAKELSKEGYDLVLVSRDQEKLEQAKKEIDENAEIIALDLSDSENCKKLYKKVGEIDLLINNAGFGTFGEFTDTDLEKELSLINTNITAVHILTKLYMQDMENRQKGQILNVASIAGYLPGPLMGTYYASKAYVVRLTQSIKAELKKKKSKIKISLLNPGPVDTNFNKVAGVKFNLTSQTPEYVAKYTIKKLKKNKFMITPRTKNKTSNFFLKTHPNTITSQNNILYARKKKIMSRQGALCRLLPS